MRGRGRERTRGGSPTLPSPSTPTPQANPDKAIDMVDPLAWLALRCAAYELLELGKPAYAVADSYVDLVKRTTGNSGAGGFVNAVVRNLARAMEAGDAPAPRPPPKGASGAEVLGAIADATSHPDWLVRRWVARLGAREAVRLMHANNRRPAFSMRALGAGGAAELLEWLQSLEGVEAEPSALLPDDFVVVRRGMGRALRAGAVSEGRAAVQDEGAGLVVAALDPQAGETILDLCAAPGGKALYSARRMKGRGTVVAADAHAGRLRRLEVALAEQGSGGASVRLLACAAADLSAAWTGTTGGAGVSLSDRRAPPPGRVDSGVAGALRLQDDLRAARRLGATSRAPPLFDRVLVDAPCSGLGVLGKRADLRWRRTEAELVAAIEAQRGVLDAAAPLVRPGGLLVYSTCSIEPDENEDQVTAFILRHPDFSLEPMPAGAVPDSVLRDGNFVATLPHVHGTDGAFAARLRRRE